MALQMYLMCVHSNIRLHAYIALENAEGTLRLSRGLFSRKQWLGRAKKGLIVLMALLALNFEKGD
jgi:hypothetical protein